jgi:hypothetical protein
MKKGKMEARKIFESIVRSQERFDLDFAMNAAERWALFGGTGLRPNHGSWRPMRIEPPVKAHYAPRTAF